MNLYVNKWKEFSLDRIFVLKGGFFNKKPEHSTIGNIPFLASTEQNNGVTEYYSLDDIRLWNKTGNPDDTLDKKIFEGNCIAVTVNGSVCNAYFQTNDFTCSHDITVLYPNKFSLTLELALFLTTIIMQDKYRWNYGRKPHDVKKFGKSIIKLPVLENNEGIPIIDESKEYSDYGYIPDWQFMEDYIKSLHHKPITTQKSAETNIKLDVDKWEDFKIENLFSKIYKAKAHTKEEVVETTNGMNFVSRTEENNGIDIVVENDNLEGIEKGNCITIGDTTATCFYQKDEFVTGDHMVVLRSDWMNQAIGLFIVTELNLEKYRYSYGRAYKMDSIKSTLLKLPIQRDEQGIPIIDNEYKYHPKGFIPDWKFMEDYINTLPFSDRI